MNFAILDRSAFERMERQTQLDLEAGIRARRDERERERGPSRPPQGWRIPSYTSPEFWTAWADGWISDEKAAEIEAAHKRRQERAKASYGTASAPPRRWHRAEPRDSRQYVNPMATTAARDDRLTPQAKALLQVIRARCGNGIETRTTKTTLGAIMSRCTRSIQRYLQELVQFGYIGVGTRRNDRGSHTGLIIRLCQKVLPFWKDDRGLAEWLQEAGDKLPDPFDFTNPQSMANNGYLFDFTGRTEMSPINYSPKLNVIIGKWAPLLASLHKRRAGL